MRAGAGVRGTASASPLRVRLATVLVVLLLGGCGPVVPSATETAPSSPAVSTATGGGCAAGTTTSQTPARNVVILVGDGLGMGARRATRLATVGRDDRLAMGRLRFDGRVRTTSAGAAVTDSAAAATALATGVRTRNGSVGVDRHGKRLASLLDVARRTGRSTGLVTTSEVTDATPAAFGAHVRDRSRQRRIARQYLRESRPDVILGGGARRWSEARLAEARERGWELVSTRRGLDAAPGPKILGLFAERRMFDRGPEGQGRYAPSVPLRTMTRKALDVMSADDDGFFLVVEEEGIDEMAHANNARLMIRATRAFHRTVRLVHRFAERNPGTLVVVVGDHETGGVKVVRKRRGPGIDGPFRIANSSQRFWVTWAGHRHTGARTPWNAEGPGARGLVSAGHLTDVHDVVLDALEGSYTNDRRRPRDEGPRSCRSATTVE